MGCTRIKPLCLCGSVFNKKLCVFGSLCSVNWIIMGRAAKEMAFKISKIDTKISKTDKNVF